MRQGFQNYTDMRQGYFLNLTCDIGINKRQGHATLGFLKFDRRHGDPPSRAPIVVASLEIDQVDELHLRLYIVVITV